MNAPTIIATFLLVVTAVVGWQWAVDASAIPDPGASTASPSPDSHDRLTSPESAWKLEFGEPNDVPTKTLVTTARKNEPLETLLRLSTQKAEFVQPTNDEITRFENLFLVTLRQSQSRDKLQESWAENGWSLTYWSCDERDFFAIGESDGHRRGRGFYVVQVGTNSNLVLQAPHRFFDTGTGSITQQLFAEHDFLAAAWNTVHRKQYDLAHRRDHFINAFTRALIDFHSETVFVQLHGFANEERHGSARIADLILSDATEYPGRLARTTAIRFKQNFGAEHVRLYPLEVRQLGGTQNEQGRLIRNQGSLGFLHIELNKSLREKLDNSACLRDAFFNSLAESSLISDDSNSR